MVQPIIDYQLHTTDGVDWDSQMKDMVTPKEGAATRRRCNWFISILQASRLPKISFTSIQDSFTTKCLEWSRSARESLRQICVLPAGDVPLETLRLDARAPRVPRTVRHCQPTAGMVYDMTRHDDKHILDDARHDQDALLSRRGCVCYGPMTLMSVQNRRKAPATHPQFLSSCAFGNSVQPRAPAAKHFNGKMVGRKPHLQQAKVQTQVRARCGTARVIHKVPDGAFDPLISPTDSNFISDYLNDSSYPEMIVSIVGM
ncbi:hypothetical protein BDN71DRAFT_1431165 [Pleurotus eryngii]|uniref:Uncharacterized protein n=1 Tax=Pleurotus eryngii TaxID=5323 RepID=A0A9P5ZVU7_PLEER|nr:hypothetical protein BDN71DRAFT_1431165 [Pleurotus eryngii]